MNLKNYKPTDTDFWTGRVDDLYDIDSFRMHQIIKLLDLKDLKDLEVDPSKFNICFLGYASDEGIRRNSGRLGAKHGPVDIRNKFASLPIPFCDQTAMYDAGNLYCVDRNLEEIQEQLAIAVENILDNNLFPIVLGGSHDVSYGHYNGIANHLKKKTDKPKIGIINFDAHFDLRPYDVEPSSGTMFAQIADDCARDNQAFNYFCVGIQTSGNTRSLFNKADSLGAKYVLAREFIESDPETISAKIRMFVNENDYIYLTVCGDVFSSSSAPGVSAVQPFGLKPSDVLRYTKEILKSKKVVGFDIAEVSPPLDDDKRTARLAANIIYAVIESLCE
ncbi:MAG TPA: formimidoylglutamase [Bacteroidales bacterium]|nr:formimidoylglutamase [Bacteroidales bacterium]